MKRDKPKRMQFTLLIELDVPNDLLASVTEDDRKWLHDLARRGTVWESGPEKTTFVFHLEDIHKVRQLFAKYGRQLALPKSSDLRQWGLKHSAGEPDIRAEGDAFIIVVVMPDGVEETHIIPKNVTFRAYYAIKRWFDAHPEVASVQTPTLWEVICKEFGLDRYFDRSGKFHKNSYFGDRRWYFYYSYYNLKILHHIGKLHYHGSTVSMPRPGVDPDDPEPQDVLPSSPPQPI